MSKYDLVKNALDNVRSSASHVDRLLFIVMIDFFAGVLALIVWLYCSIDDNSLKRELILLLSHLLFIHYFVHHALTVPRNPTNVPTQHKNNRNGDGTRVSRCDYLLYHWLICMHGSYAVVIQFVFKYVYDVFRYFSV